MKKTICGILSTIVMCSSLTTSIVAIDEATITFPETEKQMSFVQLEESSTLENTQSPRVLIYSPQWFYLARTGYSNYETHYQHNTSVDTGASYIYGQNSCSQYLIGNYTMDAKGCGVIATYNALKRNGRIISLPDIIRSFEKDEYLVVDSYFGTDPYAIGDYFDSIYVDYTEYAEPTSFDAFAEYVDDNINTRQTYIVSFWNSTNALDGAHTIAFYTENGTIKAFNRHNNDTAVTEYDSVYSLIGSPYAQEKFIVGYSLGARSRMSDE